MKKAIFLLAAMFTAMMASAEVEFAYEAGAEIVSSYMWRGQNLAGLSFQPSLGIGYEGEHTSFMANVWGSVGASDWMFKKDIETYTEDGIEIDPNTYFVPEMDITFSFSFFGATIGASHMYYFGGSKFLAWQPIEQVWDDESTSQTEVFAGYNFDDMLGVPLYFNWYTCVAGDDGLEDEAGNAQRAWSSYLELGYDLELPKDWSMGFQIGMSPWKSDTYMNEKFAVVNLSARVDKIWSWDACELSLFAQGSINPDGINKENLYINAAGDEKICCQKLNGAIGLGIWF